MDFKTLANTSLAEGVSEEIRASVSEHIKKIQSDSLVIGRLYLKNFGPIDEVDIFVKKLNVIIGSNNSGKSTLSRLLSILMDVTLNSRDNGKTIEVFQDYEIDFFEENTVLLFVSRINVIFLFEREIVCVSRLSFDEKFSGAIEQASLQHSIEEAISIADQEPKRSLSDETLDALKYSHTRIDKFGKQIRQLQPTYIPSERNIISVLSGSLFALMSSNISLPKFISKFGAVYELGRKRVLSVSSSVLIDIEYRYESGEDVIFFDDDKSIPLSIASSSIQSTIPLVVVLEYLGKESVGSLFIEEPEINLFPNAQKRMANYLSSYVDDIDSKAIFVTTHSPYVLSAFNNLIQAGALAEERPELSDDIEAIIPKESWVKFENVSAYVLEDGSARSILDEEWKGIVAEEIDKASDEIGDEYERLLDLRYKSEVAE